MERRDLPGYYYGKHKTVLRAIIPFANTILDGEKKKYFKIQENSPAGSAYSSQDVKRRKLRDEKNVERAEAEARQQGRIRRAAILQAPLAGHILHREIEQVPRYRLDGARIYCQGLLPRGRLARHMSVHGARLFSLNHRPDLGQSVVDFNSGTSIVNRVAPKWSQHLGSALSNLLGSPPQDTFYGIRSSAIVSSTDCDA